MDAPILNQLRATVFFKELPEDALQELAPCCRGAKWGKRDILFHEGAPGVDMFLLTQGSVQLVKVAADGGEVVIRTVRPGEVFAEVILFEGDRYPVTARALTAVHALALGRAEMRRLLDRPAFRDAFIAMLMRKQRYLAERVQYLAAYDVRDRFLMFLRDHYGDVSPIRPELTKKDMAAAIGATPETFSRLLKRLQQDGAVRWVGNRLEVDPGAWERVGDQYAVIGRTRPTDQ